MHWKSIFFIPASLASLAAAGRSLRHVGKQDMQVAHLTALKARASNLVAGESFATDEPNLLKERKAFQFLNSNTSSFVVNGSTIPDVDFDVGESYSGSLSLSHDPDDKNKYFFWFFPSTNPAASKEIIIWLNGGPGCSSLEGLLQENGPFIWQYGTFKPVPNTYSWNKLSNIVYVEQPVGTGFSTGTPTARDENDIASQFMGFWKNFVDTFSLHGYKVYITGESYAGMYCPYIASAMIDAKDETYFNVSGLMIYDPSIGSDLVQEDLTAVPFVDYWKGLFPFNDSFVTNIHNRDQKCGYADHRNKFLVYPPSGVQPTEKAIVTQGASGCEDLWNDIYYAASFANPCFNIYEVSTTCPVQWDVLGFPGSYFYLPDGANIYFDRDDVKKAIHAPLDITWAPCADSDVFVGSGDQSLPSAFTALPKVIDATQNVIVAHGALDYVLIANGTLLTIQNMTWGGKLGFQIQPSSPLFVPFHDDPTAGSVAGAGVMGTVHTERGLTYAGVSLSGHMVPQYQPSVAYRQLEFLLGRVSNLSSVEPLTTDRNVTQPDIGSLGNGNAPPNKASGSIASSSSANTGTTATAKQVSPATKLSVAAWFLASVAGLGVLAIL